VATEPAKTTPDRIIDRTRELSCAVVAEMSSSTLHDTLLDSGSTSHLVISREYFVDFRGGDSPAVKTANHGSLLTTGRGTCIAELLLGNEMFRVTLHDCLHAPGALINLLSVGRMLQRGWDCAFRGSGDGIDATCQLSYKGETLGTLPVISNLCHVNLCFLHPSVLASSVSLMTEISAVARVPVTLDLWHARMGHPGGEIVKRLPVVATGVQIDSSKPLSQCEACIIAKHPRKPYPPSKSPRALHMLDLIHSDLCGPFPIRTPHGKLYFVVFLDNHSHLLSVQLLTSKDQVLDAWKMVQALWENHAGRTVKVFHSDNGGEFISTAFSAVLADAGISRQLSAPYAHQQNGKAERAMHTLKGRLLAMLEAAGLPLTLWGEAVLTAAYLWNRTEFASLPPGRTPFEMVNGVKPDLSHLRIFGSHCWAHIPAELQSKLGPKSRRAVFLGYPDGTKGYRLRDAENGTFFIVRDVIFDEELPALLDPEDDDDEDDSVAALPPIPAVLVSTPAPISPVVVPASPPALSSQAAVATPISASLPVVPPIVTNPVFTSSFSLSFFESRDLLSQHHMTLLHSSPFSSHVTCLVSIT
jgi:hypothetical protein